jgi:hypothetical protein
MTSRANVRRQSAVTHSSMGGASCGAEWPGRWQHKRDARLGTADGDHQSALGRG